MVFRYLKVLRIAVSLFFFLTFLFVFLDFGQLFPDAWIKRLIWLQFVPSIIAFTGKAALITAGFILVVLMTLLYGRIYCSFLCPLGVFQDIIIRLAHYKRKIRFRYSGPYNLIRYVILTLVALVTLSGSLLLLNLLDPWTLFGKISESLFRPLVIGANNGMAWLLERAGNYTLAPHPFVAANLPLAGFALFMTALFMYLTVKHGRLYCNSICPVGAFLGLLSKYSFFRISLDRTSCTRCGACSMNCKAGCIDVRDQSVDFTRCVGCLNCLSVCPEDGVTFKPAWRAGSGSGQLPDAERRRVVRKLGNGIMLLGGLQTTTALAQVIADKKPVNRKCHATPPGSGSIEHFTRHCTACQLCVSRCPTGVLQPSFGETGITGIFQPFMDYQAHFCNYECIVCTQVCPTGAINLLTVDDKKLTQVGISKFIKENCIVYRDEKDCGACSEHCPTKAVNMVPYKTGLKIPEVNIDICIGCGACEYACPTTPKSIFVDGNEIHQTAKKPEVKRDGNKFTPPDEFPF
ncbi:MAG: 4Fe-4S binding protein [Bacteroidales bacterium]